MPDYLVKLTTKKPDTDAKPETIERIVRAKNQAKALAHVVKDVIEIGHAETDDVVRLTKAGVSIEVAE